MDNRSTSSGADPFGLKHKQPSNSTLPMQNFQQLLSHRELSIAAPAPAPNDDNKPPETTGAVGSSYNKHPLSQRLTLSTAVSADESDKFHRPASSSSRSVLTTPTSNNNKKQQHRSNNEREHGQQTEPSENTAAHYSLTESMRRLNLSQQFSSPSHLSQLSESPIEPINNRRMTASLSQTMLAHYQLQLSSSHQELELAREQKRVVEQAHRQLQKDYDRDIKDLKAQLLKTQQLNQDQFIEQQQALDKYKHNLEEQALSLKQEQEEWKEQQQLEMDQLQTTVAQLEETHEQEQDRLAQLQSDLTRKQQLLATSVSQFQAHQQQARAELDRARQEQERQLAARQERLLQQEQAARDQRQHNQSELEQALTELQVCNSSYEAKYELVEQALQEAAARRHEEEAKLNAAKQKLDEIEKQKELVVKDCNTVKQDAQDQVAAANEELARTQRAIAAAQDELNSVREMTRKANDKAEATKVDLQRQMDALLEQINLAKLEKTELETRIMDQQNMLLQKESDWQNQHDARLREEEQMLAEMRREANEESTRAIARATSEINKMADASLKETEKQSSDSLARVETMRVELEAAVLKYSQDKSKLTADQKTVAALEYDFNDKIACFAATETREKRLREELQWEAERLESLLRSERTQSQIRVDESREELELLRKRHREELISVSKRLENESDALVTSVHAEMLEKEKAFTLNEQSLLDEKLAVQMELDVTIERVFEAEARIEELIAEKRLLEDTLAAHTIESEAKISSLKEAWSDEVDARQQLNDLMGRLEKHCALVEVKETQLKNETGRLHALEEEYKSLHDRLTIEEQELARARDDLGRRESLLAADLDSYTRTQQSMSLSRILEKPLRQEREIISMTFSKWVRATLFEVAEQERIAEENQTIADLQSQQEASIRMIDELKDDRANLFEQHQLLNAEMVALNTKLLASKEMELKITEEMSMLAETKQLLENELQDEIMRLTAEKDTLQAELQHQISKLSEDKDDLQVELERRMANLSNAKQEMEDTLREEIAKLEDEKVALEERMQVSLSQSKEEQEKLQFDLDHQVQVLTTAMHEIEVRYRAEIKLLSEEKSTLQNDFETKELLRNNENSALLDEIKNLQTALSERPLSNPDGGSKAYEQVEERVKRMELLVAQRESELERKEAYLLQKEKELQAPATDFTEANAGLRDLADKLRQKELDLEFKATHLASELAQCNAAQARLQKLATHLHHKAEQISSDQVSLDVRMGQCDQLEKQLNEWQRQLEDSRNGKKGARNPN
jgi:hypothetical protein